MTDTKQNKKINPVAVGVTGAIIGAGITAVAAVALKDKKTQQKVKEVLHKVKDRTKGYIGKMKDQTTEKNEKVEKKLDESKKLIVDK